MKGVYAVIHIAIVEDVKAEADLLQGCLEQYRQDNHIVFQLHFFPDADTFLQTDTHTFDIVFMDVDMPAAMELRQAGCCGRRTRRLCFCL